MGRPAPVTEGNPFTDVVPGSYYYDAVLWAVENGITKGTSDAAFSPNRTCTRAQIITFLWRADGAESWRFEGDGFFTDVSAQDYFYSAVVWAMAYEITTGTSATAFSPDATCTRGQVVTFLHRAMNAA